MKEFTDSMGRVSITSGLTPDTEFVRVFHFIVLVSDGIRISSEAIIHSGLGHEIHFYSGLHATLLLTLA